MYFQNHNFHWNVTGPQFHELQLLFEEHHNELAIAAGDIAERIRTEGVNATGSYRELTELSITAGHDGLYSAQDMDKF